MRRQIAFGWDCVPTNRGLRSKYETAKNLISIEKFNNLVLLGTASRSWNITVFVPYLEFTVKGKEGKRREGVVLCAAKMPLRAKLELFHFLRCNVKKHEQTGATKFSHEARCEEETRYDLAAEGGETLFHFPLQPEFSREKIHPWDFPNLRVFPFLKVLFNNMFYTLIE